MTTIKTLLSVAVLAATTGSVWAQGTTAGTNIDNTASISYKVGTVTQTPIYSSPGGNALPGVPGTAGAPTVAATNTTFKVDKKIDLSVTPATDVPVTPNTSSQVLTFKVSNDGNSVETLNMTASSIAGGDFDATGCIVAPTTLPTLAVDTDTNVTVTCSIPNSGTTANGGIAGAGVVANGKTSLIHLTAEVDSVTNDTADADDPASVQTVFADAAGPADAATDAKHSAAGSYVINAAGLTVQKTSAISDARAFNNTNPKRIPGSTITYTITVSNAGSSSTATDIVISDTVSTDLETIAATVSGDGIGSATVTGFAVASNSFGLAAGETATLTITAKVK